MIDGCGASGEKRRRACNTHIFFCSFFALLGRRTDCEPLTCQQIIGAHASAATAAAATLVMRRVDRPAGRPTVAAAAARSIRSARLICEFSRARRPADELQYDRDRAAPLRSHYFCFCLCTAAAIFEGFDRRASKLDLRLKTAFYFFFTPPSTRARLLTSALFFE